MMSVQVMINARQRETLLAAADTMSPTLDRIAQARDTQRDAAIIGYFTNLHGVMTQARDLLRACAYRIKVGDLPATASTIVDEIVAQLASMGTELCLRAHSEMDALAALRSVTLSIQSYLDYIQAVRKAIGIMENRLKMM
ncbi:MAG: hypothetical protein WAU03_04930 [Candidatus Saccharimonas aalborgensis]